MFLASFVSVFCVEGKEKLNRKPHNLRSVLLLVALSCLAGSSVRIPPAFLCLGALPGFFLRKCASSRGLGTVDPPPGGVGWIVLEHIPPVPLP